MNRKQRNIYTDFHRPHYYIAYFFLICARFCFVSVLVPDSSREASFFLSFPSAAGPLLSLLERCWRLWPLNLPADVEVSSRSCRWSLINDSFLSQTSTVTPESEQEAASETESDLLILIRYQHIHQRLLCFFEELTHSGANHIAHWIEFVDL